MDMSLKAILHDGVASSLGESTPSIESAPSIEDSNGDSDVSTTLYFGNLHAFVQQSSLEDLCSYFGPVETAKVIKDKGNGSSAGYGFVKFSDRAVAESALQSLNGKAYLGQELRVNWALPNNHKEDTSHHFHIFVGDLGSDVTDAVLYNTFCTVGQCSDARVMWDHGTGRSKGYGFVSFRRKEDADAAIEQMQGRQIGSRRIRVGWAQHKQDESCFNVDSSTIDRADPSNTNVYLGNVSPETNEEDLMAHFSVYGPVAEIKLHKKGGYGFVKYELHDSAVKAIVGSHGRPLHGRVLKCAWGKNTSAVPPAAASPAPMLNLAAALQGVHLGNSQNMNGLQGIVNPTMMASLAAANLMAAAAAASGGGHANNAGFNGALLGMPAHGLMAPHGGAPALVGGGMQGLMGLNAPLMYNQASLQQMALATQLLMMQQGMHSHNDVNAMGLQAALGIGGHALTAGNMCLQGQGQGFNGGGGMYGGGFYGGSSMLQYN